MSAAGRRVTGAVADSRPGQPAAEEGSFEGEARMRIGWVGGMERREAQIERLAENAGHTVAFHRGDVGGRGAGDLRSLIERSDFVIIETGINSHGAMLLAKRIAQKLDRGTLIVRSCSFGRFQMLLDAFATRDERLLATG